MGLEKIFANKKKWIIGLCIAEMCVIAIYSIGMLANYSRFYSGLNHFTTILGLLVNLAIFAFAILAIVKENKFWTKVLFITYFSYVLFSNVFSFYSYLNNFDSNNAINICFGLFGFIDSLLVIVIGVLFLFVVSGRLKNKNVVDILIYIRLITVLVLLIIGIVAIATSGAAWYSFFAYIEDILLTLIFFIAIRYTEASGNSKQIEVRNENMEE